MLSSSEAQKKGLLVVGWGPGIGNSVARLFAAKAFTQVGLISRTLPDTEDIRSALKFAGRDHVEIHSWSADVTDTKQYTAVLQEVKETMGSDLNCVVFNAARVATSELLSFPAEEIQKDFMTTNIAMYSTAQWAFPILTKVSEKENPSFLVTSSLLWQQPSPAHFSLSLVKSSQRNLVQSLAATYPNVHSATVNVGGPVSKEDKHLNPDRIADRFWELYSQKRQDWTFDIDVLSP